MGEKQSKAGAEYRLRIWDAGTRASHWLIVACFAFSWWSAENREMEWHLWSGLAMLGLVIFRLFWGFAGSTTSRFASFVRGPSAVLRYALSMTNRSTAVTPGHNPLGGWSVVAMLGLLAGQVILGLFAVDVDGIYSGSLSWLVSFDAGRLAAQWHHLVFNFLLALTAIHIAAIIFYLVYKRENLIAAMVGGFKTLREHPSGLFRYAGPAAYITGILLAAAMVWLISTGLPWLG